MIQAFRGVVGSVTDAVATLFDPRDVTLGYRWAGLSGADA